MSNIYQGVFTHLGLPFYEDSVEALPKAFFDRRFEQAEQRLLESDEIEDKDTEAQLNNLHIARGTEKVIREGHSFLSRQVDNSIYVGDFKLEDNPDSAVTITQKRLNILDETINAARHQLGHEEDYVVRDKYQQVLNKAQGKRHKSYQEFEQPFKQSFAHNIQLKISQYEKQERKDERDHRQMVKESYDTSLKSYQERYADNIHAQHQLLYQREDFIQKYNRSPEGYLSYLKDTLSDEAYAFFLRGLRARLPAKARESGTYLLAQTKSGKSELMKTIIYNEVQQIDKPSCSIMLIDPHGDVAQEVAQFKEFATPEGRERLVYIDPLIQEGMTPSINPFELEHVTERNVDRMTQELLRVMKVLLTGAGTSLYMEAILVPCIAVLLRKPGTSFKDLQTFMDDGNNQDLVELGKQSPNPAHRDLFINKFYSDAYKQTKNGIYTRIQILLNNPSFQYLISDKTTLDLPRLTAEKKIILFRLPFGELGTDTTQAFGRFLVAMMRITALQRSPEDPKSRVDTHLFIDEVQNFISGDIEEALTQLRKFGLYMTLCNQYVGQKMDAELQTALFSTGLLIAGRNDTKSLKAVQQRLRVPLEELENLKVGEFYIKSREHPAFKIKAPTALLGSRHAMSANEWKAVIKHNLERYYRVIDFHSPEEAHRAKNQALLDEMAQSKALKDKKVLKALQKDNNDNKPKYEL